MRQVTAERKVGNGKGHLDAQLPVVVVRRLAKRSWGEVDILQHWPARRNKRVHYVDFRAIANSPPRISNVTTTDRVKKLLDRISALPNLLDTLEDENVIDLEAELAQWKLGLRAAPTELPTRKRRRDAGTKRSSETRKRKAPRTQGTRSRRKRQRSIPPEMDQFLSTMVLDSAPPVPVDDDIVDVILGTGTVHITPNGIPKGTTILREPPQPITTPMLDPPIANPSWGHALMALPQDLASSREETSRDSFSSDDERFFFYWKDHPDTNNGNDIPTPNTSPEIDHATSHELPQPHHDPPTSLACQSSATANSENTSPPEGRHVGMQDVDTQMAPSRDTTSHIVDNPMAQIPPLARTPHTTETTQPQQLTGPPMRVASEAHTSPAMKASSASSIEYSMEIGVIPTANYTALNNITTPPSDDLGMLSSYSPVNFNPLEYHDPNGGHSEDEPDVDDLFSDIMGQSNELPPLHSHGSMLLDLINTSSAHNNHNNHNACPPTTPPHNDEATSLLSPSFNFVADEISLEVPPICTTSSQGPSSSSSVQHPDQPAFPPPPSSSSATSSATTPWTYFPTTTTTSSQPPAIPTPRVDNSNHTATPTAPVYYYHSPTPFPLPFMNWSAFSPPSQRGNLKTPPRKYVVCVHPTNSKQTLRFVASKGLTFGELKMYLLDMWRLGARGYNDNNVQMMGMCNGKEAIWPNSTGVYSSIPSDKREETFHLRAVPATQTTRKRSTKR